MKRLLSRRTADTHALGRALGEAAVPGTVLALVGDLGAGKTALAQGVGEGLGVADAITSPTFVLIQRYDDGRLTLWHADLYRLDDPRELDEIGLDEALGGDGIAVVEWADKHEERLPDDHLRVTLRHLDGAREIELEATGPRHEALLAALDG